MDVLKISATSNPKSVAGALAAVLREKGVAEIQAVGAGAVTRQSKPLPSLAVMLRRMELTWFAPPVFQK
jgi:stage V sporulation protein SpoVS